MQGNEILLILDSMIHRWKKFTGSAIFQVETISSIFAFSYKSSFFPTIVFILEHVMWHMVKTIMNIWYVRISKSNSTFNN